MKKITNIPKSFVGFLILSTFIWLVINLSKVYQTRVAVEVSYVGLAQDKILKQAPLFILDLQVQATGFELISSSFSKKKIELSLENLEKNLKGTYYLLPNTKQKDIQNQLSKTLLVQSVVQDSVFFDIGILSSKKVPLVLDLAIAYELGFDATKNTTITPDSVLVSGSKSDLNTIEHVALEQLSLKQVSQDIKTRLQIVPPKIKNLNFSTQSAQVFVEVDKFTEGEFEIPILVENTTPTQKLTTYPQQVKVIFKVGLKNYNKVVAESFSVVADYQFSKQNDLSYLIPKLKSKSKFVTSVRIVPEKVDFLIHK